MKEESFNFREIEIKWQRYWEEKKFFSPCEENRKKFYCLEMFPYPSGRIHMGHVRNYVIGDVIAQYKRMNGFEVLHPIGWDAFGLPAENAAIKNRMDPETWTKNNIEHMRGQLKTLGISYDWEREFATCDDSYYRWNQWFFIKMYERGLVYRKFAPVNWCPACATVLANEQVENGTCWRCNTQIEEKELNQWFVKITEYAEELLEGHEILKDNWPEEVIIMQRNWIGKSIGAEIDFKLVDSDLNDIGVIRVFTTRPDTLFGATFLTLSPEHPLIYKNNLDLKKDINDYLKKCKKRKFLKSENLLEKEGVFTGLYAINPVNGNKIPVWISDYVKMEYGTGAIMCVPAHDQRDYDFARKYGLPIIQVVDHPSVDLEKQAYEGDGVAINSGEFNGLETKKFKEEITEYLIKKNIGTRKINYKLKDWLISRQRYWGTPIPVIYCEKCGIVPVDEKDLPVKLPSNIKITGCGESPLKYVDEFVNVKCYKCGMSAKRETDTMDTFFDSSWYYARYCDPKNSNSPFDFKKADYWLPVDQYIGGIEHACMHLIYARFFHKFIRDLGLVKSDEPFKRLLTQGMVTLGGFAMSKSRGNVVEPSSVIEKYGADSVRLFILFAAPPEKSLEWSDRGIEGMTRFIKRIIRLKEKIYEKKQINIENSSNDSDNLLRTMHRTVKKVTDDIENRYQFNTAIASLMELLNEMYLYKNLGDETSKTVFEKLILMLSPFAPHICEEIYQDLKNKGEKFEKESIRNEQWPRYDNSMLVEELVEIVVQVNGKLRGKVRVRKDTPEHEIIKIIENNDEIKKFYANGIVKTVYVKNKILNIVSK